jgi:hypothetical protein
VPFVLERLDYTWQRSRYEGVDCSRLPSEVFAQHFWVCMVADRYAVINRHLIGLDKLLCGSATSRTTIPIGELNARRVYNFW